MKTTEQIDIDIQRLTQDYKTTLIKLLKEKELATIKVDDYVIVIDNQATSPQLSMGYMHKVSKVNNEFVIDNGYSYMTHRFRKATDAEVDIGLLAEAAKKGFVIGCKVQWEAYGTPSTIDEIYVCRSRDGDSSPAVNDWWAKHQQPFVVLRGLNFGRAPALDPRVKLFIEPVKSQAEIDLEKAKAEVTRLENIIKTAHKSMTHNH